jgi:hypothetical protein
MRTEHAAHDSEPQEEVIPEHGPRDGRLSPRAEPEAPSYVLVILPAQDIRLPEVLRHIEAGRIVLVIPGIKAKPKEDRS